MRVTAEYSGEGFVARVAGRQGSGVVSTLSRVDGLLVIPEAMPAADDGALLPVQMLDWDTDS